MFKNLILFLFYLLISSTVLQVECFAADPTKSCGTTSCKDLSELVLSVVGKISIPFPTRQTFSTFKEGSSMLEILRAAGVPSKDVGSGLFVFVYEFEDGTSCTVGTGDLRGKATYVKCD